jgi:hypothetical protein
MFTIRPLLRRGKFPNLGQFDMTAHYGAALPLQIQRGVDFNVVSTQAESPYFEAFELPRLSKPPYVQVSFIASRLSATSRPALDCNARNLPIVDQGVAARS